MIKNAKIAQGNQASFSALAANNAVALKNDAIEMLLYKLFLRI